MVFLLFLVSLGAVHLILAAEDRRKKESRRPVEDRGTAQDVVLLPPASPEATSQGVFSLLQAIEQHGRGEQPGNVPTAPRTPAEVRKD